MIVVGGCRRTFSNTVNALESAQAFTMTFQFNLSCGAQSLNLIILSCIACMAIHIAQFDWHSFHWLVEPIHSFTDSLLRIVMGSTLY